MSDPIYSEDWEELIKTLNSAIELLGAGKSEPARLAILDFGSTAGMLGLEDLARVGKQFEEFLKAEIAPGGDQEAVATLSFAMGALVEKMQMQTYGPQFSSGLDEITLYLSFYEKEAPPPAVSLPVEPEPEPPVPIQAAGPEALFTPVEEAESGPEALAKGPVIEAPSVEVPAEPILAHEAPEAFMEASPPESAESLGPEKAVSDLEYPAMAAGEEIGLQEETRPGVPDECAPEGLPDPLEASPSELPTRAKVAEPAEDLIGKFQELLKHDPTSRIFAPLAEGLCARGMWEEAVAACRRGLVFHPDHLRGRALLGWALWEMGEAGEAESTLSEVRRDLESNSSVFKLLSEISRDRGDLAEAQRLITLYKGLMGEELQAPVGAVHVEQSGAPAPGSDPDAPVLAALLASLLKGFEEKPTIGSGTPQIFSEAQRRSLGRMIADNSQMKC